MPHHSSFPRNSTPSSPLRERRVPGASSVRGTLNTGLKGENSNNQFERASSLDREELGALDPQNAEGRVMWLPGASSI